MKSRFIQSFLLFVLMVSCTPCLLAAPAKTVNSINDIGTHVLGQYDVRLYGMKGDYRPLTGLTAYVDTSFVDAPSSTFNVLDVGRTLNIPGAGAGGADLVVTITAYVSSTRVSISAPASTAVSAVDGFTGTDNTMALSALVNTTITSGTVSLSGGPYYIGSSITIPKNVTLKFEGDASLYIAENAVVKIGNSHIDAPLAPIFTGPGNKRVEIAGPVVHPEWFGAVGDNVNDDTLPINAALATIRANPYQTITAVTLSMTSGSAVVTPSATTWFSAADVLKTLLVPGAGPGGSNLISGIKSYNSGTGALTLFNVADTTVSGKTGYYTGGGTLVFNAGGHYKTTATVRPAAVLALPIDILNHAVDNLTIQGNNAHIVNAGGDTIPYTCAEPTDCTINTGVFSTMIAMGSNVTINDLNFDHTHVFSSTTPAGAVGSDIRVTQDANLIEGNTLWMGAPYSQPSTPLSANNITVSKCSFDGSWYAAIRPIYAGNVHVEKCKIFNSLATGIWPGSAGDGYWILDNDIENGQDDAFFIGAGDAQHAIHNVFVERNKSINNQGRIGFGGVYNGWIQNNTFYNTNSSAISLVDGNGYSDEGNKHIHINYNNIEKAGWNWGPTSYITDNHVSAPAIMCGAGDIRGEVEDVEIVGNQIWDSYKEAINWPATNKLRIANNTIYNTGDVATSIWAAGINVGQRSPTPVDMKNVQNLTLENNTVVGTTATGIIVNYTSMGTIQGNIVTGYGEPANVSAATDWAFQLYHCNSLVVGPNYVKNDNGAEAFWDLSGSVNTFIGAGNAYMSPLFGDYSPTYTYLVIGLKQAYGSTAAPVTGSWAKGDIIWNQTPADGAAMGISCTTPGTSGTLTGGLAISVTGGITSTTDSLTVGSTDMAAALYVGEFINVAGLSSTAKISAISDTTITLQTTTGGAYSASATVAAAAVTEVMLATTTASSATASNIDTSNIRMGQYLTIAGTTFNTGTAYGQVKSVDSTAHTVTFTATADSTVSTPAAIAYSAPVWTSAGIIGTLPSSRGGTGTITNTAHGVMIGEGISPMATTAAGGAGTILQGLGSSADPQFTSTPTIGGHTTYTNQWTTNSITGVPYITSSLDTTSGFSIGQGSASAAVPLVMKGGQASVVWTGTPGASSLFAMSLLAPDTSTLNGNPTFQMITNGGSAAGSGVLGASVASLYASGFSGGLALGTSDATNGIKSYVGGTSTLASQLNSTGLTVTNTLTAGQVIDSGVTASTLIYANGSKQLTSATVGGLLSFSGGALGTSSVTIGASELNLFDPTGKSSGTVPTSDGANGITWSTPSTSTPTLNAVTTAGSTTTNVITTGGYTIGSSGPTITAGAGAPSSSPPAGSLYLNTTGAATANLYIRDGDGVWRLPLLGFAANVDINFGSIPANATSDMTATATGAAVTDQVVVSSNDGLESGLVMTAWVSSTNTVTIRIANVTTGAIDPADHVYSFHVVRF